MKIGIHGINGKMGLAIAHEIMAHPDLELGAASVRNGHEWAGKRLCDVAPDLPDCTVRITSNLDQFCAAVDVVVDFTRPDATLAILPVCQKLKKPLMIGTTGFNQDATAWIHRAAQHIPLVLAANTSLGVNILFEVSRRVAEVLDFQHWDVDILEAHHRNKVDAPSGTALRLGEMIAAAQDSDFDERKRYPYVNRRKTGDIGFSVVRAGDVIGEHTVFFTADDERLEFTHRASNRRIFARGALTAASWLGDRPAGLYSMADVLGFTS
ncbi:4-hydroxy-tetrahydrodipicolinate reductase [Cardiobacterium hominis]|jgi:dihydrodipicolinate reductase|uniref:4-hydroxy-tetrahydrodipicolinate reductase n=1 Tax=Cardiobacterium hominis (strain ATCC 15826 / DSM 8339 / NCTC 10426 / 6573) TaxID=638300 RepID=C8N7S6_CARH6|nr:4-hydroxy-tetrahydrodipicolinate reductase [Cardiobacterium hominis]EEV89324.1 dihydrodipicolinate reductase [Cardiobacterium hominis ATCC 15826]RKW14649.1 MAG: 4-hydroxy-tetrahydrodipicolinate reductase [Cardiobacterium sp.]VEG77166.1 Dihydrodipicolinate reductase [Cardiobacterium hominis]